MERKSTSSAAPFACGIDNATSPIKKHAPELLTGNIFTARPFFSFWLASSIMPLSAAITMDEFVALTMIRVPCFAVAVICFLGAECPRVTGSNTTLKLPTKIIRLWLSDWVATSRCPPACRLREVWENHDDRVIKPDPSNILAFDAHALPPAHKSAKALHGTQC